MNAKQRLDQYNAGLLSADELDSLISLENMASDQFTYLVIHDGRGRARLIVK